MFRQCSQLPALFFARWCLASHGDTSPCLLFFRATLLFFPAQLYVALMFFWGSVIWLPFPNGRYIVLPTLLMSFSYEKIQIVSGVNRLVFLGRPRCLRPSSSAWVKANITGDVGWTEYKNEFEACVKNVPFLGRTSRSPLFCFLLPWDRLLEWNSIRIFRGWFAYLRGVGRWGNYIPLYSSYARGYSPPVIMTGIVSN
jgi:hypothetical protein